MSPNYRERRRLRLRERSMRGVAARERKRQQEAEAVDVVECGRLVFSGPAFNGDHTIRLLHRTGAPVVFIECDGRPLRPQTLRGVRAMLARRIWQEMSP